jgi:hypothetical protein
MTNNITTREFALPMYDDRDDGLVSPSRYWNNFYRSLPCDNLGVVEKSIQSVRSIQSELALQGAVLEYGMLYFASDEDRTAFLLRWL